MRVIGHSRLWGVISYLYSITVAFCLHGRTQLEKIRGRAIAMGAKTICSGIYVAERPFEQVRDKDAAAIKQCTGLFDLFSNAIFVDAKADRAVIGRTTGDHPFQVVAAYRPGLGCAIRSGAPGPVVDGQSCIPPSDLLPADQAWPEGNPSSLVAPSEPLALAIRRVVDEQMRSGNNTQAIVVVHQGRIVAEAYAPGLDADTRLLGWSMAKSVTGMMVGLVIGLDRVDEPISRWIPRKTGDKFPEEISIRHLLGMRSGLQWREGYINPDSDVNRMLFDEPDMGLFAANKPLENVPGSSWKYSSGTSNLLQLIIRRELENIGGYQQYCQFPYREIFHRIGAYSARMEADCSGTYVGSSYLYATPRDWARLGLLLLREGHWPPSGEQILPRAWVRNSLPSNSPDRKAYGWHLWGYLDEIHGALFGHDLDLPNDAYHMRGHWGQSVSMIPSEDLVVVRLGWNTGHKFNARRFVSKLLKGLRRHQSQ